MQFNISACFGCGIPGRDFYNLIIDYKLKCAAVIIRIVQELSDNGSKTFAFPDK